MGQTVWSSVSPRSASVVGSDSPSSVVTSDGLDNSYSPHSQRRDQNQIQTRSQMRANDKCFRCGEKGHWANECPTKTPTPKKSETPSSAIVTEPMLGADGVRYLPSLLCSCGLTPALLTSNTPRNPDRKFYSCPNSKNVAKGRKCKYFKWYDEVTPGDFTNVPICRCGAGLCQLSTETTGPSAGNKVFICPIKRGQGACDFSQLKDAKKMTSTNDHVDESVRSQSPLFNFDDLSSEDIEMVEKCLNYGEVETEPPKQDNLQNPTKYGTFSELLRVDGVLLNEVKGQGEASHQTISETNVQADEIISFALHPTKFGTFSKLQMESVHPQEMEEQAEIESSGEALRKRHKRLRNGAEKIDDSVIGSSTKHLNRKPQRSMDPLKKDIDCFVLTSEKEIRCSQVEFWRQISLAGMALPDLSTSTTIPFTIPLALQIESSLKSEIDEDLALQLRGWWGRLAFPPSWCLRIPSPKPFFCCIFPCFDPIPVPKTYDMSEVDVLINRPNNLLAAKHNRLLMPSRGENVWQPNVIPHKHIAEGVQKSAMDGVISEAFNQAALHLQRDLLSLLETIDVHDHKRMEQEASITFAALDRLLVDCQPFFDQVRDFISYAASLAEIKMTICKKRPIQELVDRYNLEKRRFDGLYHDHAKAASALEASRKRVKVIRSEALRIKNMLLEIEAELSCSEAEESSLEEHAVDMYMQKEAAEYSYKLAFKEAEEAVKLRERREELQNAAKAAYEKAKLLAEQ